jgi:hypothetical protein
MQTVHTEAEYDCDDVPTGHGWGKIHAPGQYRPGEHTLQDIGFP